MKSKYNKILLMCICCTSLVNCDVKVISENGNSNEDISNVNSEIQESSIEEISSEEAIPEEFVGRFDMDNLNPNEDKLLAEKYRYCVPVEDLIDCQPANWNQSYAGDDFDDTDAFYEETYVNNILVPNDTITVNENDDVKSVFYDKEDKVARFASLSDGYCVSIPTDTRLNCDFSLGKYRSKLYNEKMTITLSYEHSNPYSKWETYRNEWLFRFLDNEKFYIDNNIEAIKAARTNDGNIKSGYIVDRYDITINDPLAIKKFNYHIAAVRKSGSIKDFYLIVLKATEDCSDILTEMIYSLDPFFDRKGTANNSYIENMEVKYNPNWSEETRRYYQHLLESDFTGWGMFTGSLSAKDRTDSKVKATDYYIKQQELSSAMDYKFDILPTYDHISWGRDTSAFSFPGKAAYLMAGGNGFNDLPVLQMSYQFTSNNNNLGIEQDGVSAYTPMFDLYRGYSDDIQYFTAMNNRYYGALKDYAKSLKEYGKPVLFRLNNEMNTDWTSYCGMMCLLDPDIFQATWRMIYNLFEEQGVNNLIWIFNPISKTCPYSSWGEDMCYFPGTDYVQALGLTDYTFNNDNTANTLTFRNNYTALYNKNNPVWKNYPWIISEFACGSGGETTGSLFRNQQSQSNYIKGMFADFNDRENHPYLQNIKGAVWFSCNDYSGEKVSNQLELVVDKLPLSIAALKQGLIPNTEYKKNLE